MLWFVKRLGMVETVAKAVDYLLDRKQRNQNAAYRNRRVQRSYRRQRRHAEAGKAAQEIEITKNDKADGDTQHDEPSEDFDRGAEFSSQALGNRSEIEMIVTARRNRGAKKNRINKEGR